MALTKRMKLTGAVLGAAVAGAIALVPVLAEDGRQRDAISEDGAAADSKEALPSYTATDWVSYGDHVAVVRVSAEHEESGLTQEEAEAGEGYVARSIDLRVKERVWARSGVPALPDALSVVADGWELDGDQRTPLAPQDASRLEVGHDYVIAFARFPDDKWAPVGSGGILPYDNGRIGQGEFRGKTVTVAAYRAAQERRLIAGEEKPVAFRTAGSPATALGGLLKKTPPDTTAARYFDLDAIARYQKVAGETEPPADTFCSVASPLAVSEANRYTSDELASVLTDLAGMTDEGASSLRAYAASLQSGDGTSADSASRKASITRIEQECGIDVGDLLPNDTDAKE
ncbi:hypothetical protein ACIPM2_17140 [Streptomyces sp. NPDC086081]|uniref:hypothetical protein n=1 Tax=unclassified Streptomyces TaxID=2593676 RepID=UPI003427EA09